MRSGAVMQSSYLRMTRSQTVMTKRWRNQSSHELKKQFEKFQGLKVTQSKECQEILARTRQGLASGEQTDINTEQRSLIVLSQFASLHLMSNSGQGDHCELGGEAGGGQADGAGQAPGGGHGGRKP